MRSRRWLVCWAVVVVARFLAVVGWTAQGSRIFSSSSSSTFVAQDAIRAPHLGSSCAMPVSSPANCGFTVRAVPIMGLRGKKLRRLKREARKELTPPRIETPYGPIRFMKPATVCQSCQGRGAIRCGVCEGRGVIRATGLQKRNSLPKKLVSSQWTSVEVYRGHRHHTVMEVVGSPRSSDAEAFKVRMRNCCGPTSDFWIPVNELRNKRVWRMGWLTLEDILQADGGPLIDARLCFRCKGGKILRCLDCDGQGEIPSYEPLYD